VVSLIAQNIQAVRQRIDAAAHRAGRLPQEITLVAVSKTQPPELVIEACQSGLRHFGENRVPEGNQKALALAEWLARQENAGAAKWHFIGHIQSRQAELVLEGHYGLLHSVDSLKLARRLNRLAAQNQTGPINVLLQCNVSGEVSKFGFDLNQWQTDPRQLATFVSEVEAISQLEHVAVQGLMTMAPWSANPEDTRPTFRSLFALRETLRTKAPQFQWPQLSMGMTDDFEIAIEEGATIIRVGRAIFGERTYP
jgi:hypothetical protein